MGTTDNFGSTMDPQTEQTSMVGPSVSLADPHDPNAQPMVGPTVSLADPHDANAQHHGAGIPELTPQEQELVRQQLLKQETLGLYTNAALLANVLDSEDANRQNPIKSKSGVWLQPGDPDYVAARDAIERQGAPNHILTPEDNAVASDKTAALDGNLDEKTHKETKLKQDEESERQLRKETVEHLQTMVAVNEGSVEPHTKIDEVVLQKLRKGASTMDLKDMQGKLAAINGFTLGGQVEDINPEHLGNLHADARPTGPGADKAYAYAQKQKSEKNEKFMTEMLSRQKKLGDA